LEIALRTVSTELRIVDGRMLVDILKTFERQIERRDPERQESYTTTHVMPRDPGIPALEIADLAREEAEE